MIRVIDEVRVSLRRRIDRTATNPMLSTSCWLRNRNQNLIFNQGQPLGIQRNVGIEKAPEWVKTEGEMCVDGCLWT